MSLENGQNQNPVGKSAEDDSQGAGTNGYQVIEPSQQRKGFNKFTVILLIAAVFFVIVAAACGILGIVFLSDCQNDERAVTQDGTQALEYGFAEGESVYVEVLDAEVSLQGVVGQEEKVRVQIESSEPERMNEIEVFLQEGDVYVRQIIDPNRKVTLGGRPELRVQVLLYTPEKPQGLAREAVSEVVWPYEKIWLTGKAGAISVEEIMSNDLNCTNASGEVEVRQVLAKSCTLNSLSGEIKFSDIDAEEFFAISVSGEIEGTKMRVGKEEDWFSDSETIEWSTKDSNDPVRIHSVSGEIQLEKIEADALEVVNKSGKIELSNAQVLESLAIRTVSGAIELSDADCGFLDVVTVSGGIKGSEILSPAVNTETVSGNCRILFAKKQNSLKASIVSKTGNVAYVFRKNFPLHIAGDASFDSQLPDDPSRENMAQVKSVSGPISFIVE